MEIVCRNFSQGLVIVFKNYIGWHLELTRRCPLKCPACIRTYMFDEKVINSKQDIDINLLKNFFKQPSLTDIQYMLLQGNLGDPIYHPKFHEISEWFFDVKNLEVVTNGMHTRDFWLQTLETWPSNSKITLSIDGLRDTNHVYRVNSKWNQIEDLFELIYKTKRKCKISWKYIVFEHNYHQVNEAKQLSDSLGIDEFRIQKSRKMDESINVKQYHSDEWFKHETLNYEDSISPFCFTGDMHYIDSFGDYYPCCWWADTNSEDNFWTPVNIKDNDVFICKNKFDEFSKSLNDYKCSPKVCKTFCRKVSDNELDLVTPNTQLNRVIIKNDKSSC